MVVSAYDRQGGVANSGRACLQMAQHFHSDIVFLDVGMPDLSGDVVAIALRRLPALEYIYDAAVMG